MKIFILLLLLGTQNLQAHNDLQEEPSEEQQVLQMLHDEIMQTNQEAQMLSNTILSAEVDSSQKCSALESLKIRILNMNLAINDFMQRAGVKLQAMIFGSASDDPNVGTVMFILSAQSQAQSLQTSAEIFKNNLHCN